MKNVDFLILGYGFTAEAIVKKINRESPDAVVQGTSRQGGYHIEFDLNKEETWQNLPQARFTLWSFPPVPLQAVKNFYDAVSERLGQLIVIGSTSALKVSKPNDTVDETTTLDLSIERVQSEVYLKQQGAIVVLSSGIYGPGRNPLNWVKQGYVGKNKKYVNMIHVDDLAEILFKASLFGKKGQLYIASDNNPQTWQDVIESWESKGWLANTPYKESHRVSKKVNSTKTLSKLQIKLQHKNFSEQDFCNDELF